MAQLLPKKPSILLVLFLCSVTLTLCAQERKLKGTKLLDNYLLENKTEKANTELKRQISDFETMNLIDSLAPYPYYVGKVASIKFSAKEGMYKAEEFVSQLKQKNASTFTQYKSLMSLCEFYDELGENKKSYDKTQEALGIAKKIDSLKPEAIGKLEYNLGANSQRLGNNDAAKKYFKIAKAKYESSSTTPKKDLSKVYNATAVMLYLSSKLDSAEIYFKKASDTIKIADGDKNENLLDATVIQSNVMLVQYLQGNIAQALKTLEGVVRDYNTVVKNAKDQKIVEKANRFNANAITNLAVIYSEVGNVMRANEVLEYAYNKRKSHLEPTAPQLATILIQLGQSHLSLQNFDVAIAHLSMGVKNLETSENDNLYWRAAGLFAMAEAYIALEETEKAKAYYVKSQALFEMSLKNEYDAEFLHFLRNKALFLSKIGEKEEAVKAAKKGYDYIIKNEGSDYIQNLKNTENLSRVYYNTRDFEQAKYWAESGIALLDKQIKQSKTSLDSIQIEFNKPSVILLLSKSEYELNTQRDEAFLNSLLDKLEASIKIFEKRKTISTTNEDISILLSDYKETTDFAERIQLELFQKTKNITYLNGLINLHESGIYNRIRAHLNTKQDISFSNVPSNIIGREKKLKKQLNETFTIADGETNSIQKYFQKKQEFNVFMDTLQKSYPEYYKMRYATILESLDAIQPKIPNNTTVIRYLFIEDALYALVITPTHKSLISLPFNINTDLISKLETVNFNPIEMGSLLNSLYNQLWKPLENAIKTKNVLIIPDGPLFNLSFEMLTPNKIKTFEDIAKNSLLAKHIISYNYNLLLVDKDKKAGKYSDNFIAFAPEFTNDMKTDYKLSITDSLDIDKTYLTLLPQPFSVELATKTSKTFNGTSFLNLNSTEHIFKNNAREHKIIHIGTHAESNNISPELSRLIFAKSVDSDEDNSLYTYEIYNTNLSSNLAILTACETGKPTYQSGEGMISLAHAFNYAGSESMLTSLWKIDEQSSTKIISHFYDELAKGLPKDEALKNAKVIYLATAEGRTLAPQYWAGLVLIGDTSPIELSGSINWWIWVVVFLGVVLVFLFLLKIRTKKEKRQFLENLQ